MLHFLSFFGENLRRYFSFFPAQLPMMCFVCKRGQLFAPGSTFFFITLLKLFNFHRRFFLRRVYPLCDTRGPNPVSKGSFGYMKKYTQMNLLVENVHFTIMAAHLWIRAPAFLADSSQFGGANWG